VKMKPDLTAPCGLDCFNCEVCEENISPQMRAFLAGRLNKRPEEVGCKGCRESNGCRLHLNGCSTLDCVRSRGLGFCFECSDFPCDRLAPALDGADKYPHNMKLFNLCRMKAVGVEKWAESEAASVRKRYFKGRLVIGSAPVV